MEGNARGERGAAAGGAIGDSTPDARDDELDRSVPAYAPDALQQVQLEAPFAYECSGASLRQLLLLAARAAGGEEGSSDNAPDPNAAAILVSALRAVGATLAVMNASTLRDQDLGLAAPFRLAEHCSETGRAGADAQSTKPAHSADTERTLGSAVLSLLLSLLRDANTPREAQVAAAEALEHGFELVVPHSNQRLSLLMSLLRQARSQPHGDAAQVSGGTALLLTAVLHRMESPAAAASLVPSYSANSAPTAAHMAELRRQGRALLLLVAQLADTLLDVAASSVNTAGQGVSEQTPALGADAPPGARPLADYIASLLSLLLRHAVLEVASAARDEEEEEEASPGLAAQRAAALDTGAGTVSLVLSRATRLLLLARRAAQNASEAMGQAVADTVTGTALWGLAQSAVVAAYAACDGRIRFAQALLPPLVALGRAASALNDTLPASVARADEAALRIARAPASPLDHTRGAGAGEGALDSETAFAATFSTERSGANMRMLEGGSTVESDTNDTHAALAATTLDSGLASWEFELVSDTASDEASLFGAVVGSPGDGSRLTSYQDRTALMYRSFNGQLYNQGSDGSRMRKVHPGDRVRFELNLVAGTLAVSVNGDAPQVAFEGVTGPVTPAAMTYRRGVRVKLCFVQGHNSGNFTRGPLSDPDRLALVPCSDPVAAALGAAPISSSSSGRVTRANVPDAPAWVATTARHPLGAGTHRWSVRLATLAEDSTSQRGEPAQGSRSLPTGGALLGVVTEATSTRSPPPGFAPASIAWHASGAVYAGGVCVVQRFPAAESGLRAGFKQGDVVTLQVAVRGTRTTLRLSRNGQDLGIAVGAGAPTEAAAAAGDGVGPLLPAVSLHTAGDDLRWIAAGAVGTLVLSPLLDAEKAVATSVGAAAATVVRATTPSPRERALADWARHPLFCGGLLESEEVHEGGEGGAGRRSGRVRPHGRG